MLWDESQAYMNGRFDAGIKSILTNGGVAVPPVSTTTSKPATTSTPTSTSHSTSTTSTSKPPTTGSCAGVAAWSSAVAYTGGAEVVYNGQLWTDKWWTEADTPGGAAGVWTDIGTCTSSNIATAGVAQAVPAAQMTRVTKGANSAAKATPSVEASAAKTVAEAAKTVEAQPSAVVSASDSEESSLRTHPRSFQA